jgi:hypothetical protein
VRILSNHEVIVLGQRSRRPRGNDFMTGYLLYDNRTWVAGSGTDWGLKVANGTLALKEDVQKAFLGYCRATADGVPPRGFGSALGGFPTISMLGYVVCVTLELDDLHGRPSWAVIGFCFEEPTDLLFTVRQFDFIRSAREIVQGDSPPASIVLQDRTELTQPMSDNLPYPGSDSPVVRFQRDESPRHVEQLIVRSCELGAFPSAVLGVTARADIDSSVLGRYKLVYSLSDEAVAMNRYHMLRSEVAADTRLAAERGKAKMAVISEARAQEAAPDVQSRSASAMVSHVVMFFILVVSLSTIVPQKSRNMNLRTERAVASMQRSASIAGRGTIDRGADFRYVGPAERFDSTRGETSESPVNEVDARRERLLLARLSVIVRCFDALDPKDLLAARRRVLRWPEEDSHHDRNQALGKAFEHLLTTRLLVTGHVGDSLAYFTRDSGKVLPPAEQLRGIRSVLSLWRRNQEDCALISSSLGSRFDREEVLLRQWCDAAEQLATLADEEF